MLAGSRYTLSEDRCEHRGHGKGSLDSHETGFFKLCGKTTQDLDKKPLADRPLPGSCIYYSLGKGWKVPPPQVPSCPYPSFPAPKEEAQREEGIFQQGLWPHSCGLAGEERLTGCPCLQVGHLSWSYLNWVPCKGWY